MLALHGNVEKVDRFSFVGRARAFNKIPRRAVQEDDFTRGPRPPGKGRELHIGEHVLVGTHPLTGVIACRPGNAYANTRGPSPEFTPMKRIPALADPARFLSS